MKTEKPTKKAREVLRKMKPIGVSVGEMIWYAIGEKRPEFGALVACMIRIGEDDVGLRLCNVVKALGTNNEIAFVQGKDCGLLPLKYVCCWAEIRTPKIK